jgi:hypothetical protein
MWKTEIFPLTDNDTERLRNFLKVKKLVRHWVGIQTQVRLTPKPLLMPLAQLTTKMLGEMH